MKTETQRAQRLQRRQNTLWCWIGVYPVFKLVFISFVLFVSFVVSLVGEVDATACSSSTSRLLSSLHRPSFKRASLIGPMAIRFSCVTGWPMASHIFRT